MSTERTFAEKFWRVIKALGLLIAIPAGIAEFSGKNIGNLIDEFWEQSEKKCLAPDVIGKREDIATTELNQLGFKIVKRWTYDSAYAAGTVMSQKPAPNDEIKGCEGDFYLEINTISPKIDTLNTLSPTAKENLPEQSASPVSIDVSTEVISSTANKNGRELDGVFILNQYGLMGDCEVYFKGKRAQKFIETPGVFQLKGKVFVGDTVICKFKSGESRTIILRE